MIRPKPEKLIKIIVDDAHDYAKMVVEDALVYIMPCPSASFPTLYIPPWKLYYRPAGHQFSNSYLLLTTSRSLSDSTTKITRIHYSTHPPP